MAGETTGPRVTVKHAGSRAEVTATTGPERRARCATGPACPKKPGSMMCRQDVHDVPRMNAERFLGGGFQGGVDALRAAATTMDPARATRDHVDVLAVQAGTEPRALDHTSSAVPTANPAPPATVDDPVHHRHQRVHVVRREQHRDPPRARASRASTRDDPPARWRYPGWPAARRAAAAPRPADQRVRDHDPLLLAAGPAPPHPASRAVPPAAPTAVSMSSTSSRRARDGSLDAELVARRGPERGPTLPDPQRACSGSDAQLSCGT